MTAPLILALDISKSCTGIAFGRAGEAPTFMSIVGKEMDDVAAMMKLGTWLIEFTKVNRPDWIFYEAPIDRVLTDAHTTIVLAKMTAVVEFVAGMKGIEHRKANIQTVRVSFLGQGRPDDPKHFAKLMAEALGWAPRTLDEADAASVFYHAAMKVGRNAATYITPMLRAQVTDQHEAARLSRKRRRA
jgi:Holliday junction resolvasome RuvABC endonuclease subunit